MIKPILDYGEQTALRDPAAFFQNGIYHCFYTVVEETENSYQLFVDVARSKDLVTWSTPRRLTSPGLNFSSPGNVIRHNDKWILCLQSYPINPGEPYGNEDSRLWLMASDDLKHWDAPRPLQPQGCQADWSESLRQIDPYLVEHDGQFWCFYKNSGKLGLLVSPDLHEWREASTDHPVLSPEMTPDSSSVENPCVIRDGDQFVLFFARCRKGKGIGTARSDDLIHWRDVRYIDFPNLPWARRGADAAMVLDTRKELGRWTMFFHSNRGGPHRAALGLAWSDDLVHWSVGQS